MTGQLKQMPGVSLVRNVSCQTDAELVSAFRSTDWNFHHSTTENDAHNIHPFPAKFIAQIPRKVLELVSVSSGTAVLDPFCGSGTTLLEAQNAGHSFVGVDLNPIAVLISRVKTDGLQPDALDVLRSTVEVAQDQYKLRAYVIPDIPRLSHWFRPDVASAMACLVDAIRDAKCTDALRQFMRLSLSAITVRVSNQESETRYAAIEKRVSGEDVFRLLERSGCAIASKLSKSYSGLFSPTKRAGLVIQADARNIGQLTIPPVSVVITSPPYPNAFEYWLYNKYRMYWLGYDPISVRGSEIGARPHYVSPNGDTLHDFATEMAAAFVGVAKHLINDAVVAIVVSSQCKIRGEVLDVPTMLENALVEIGYAPLARVTRTIPRTRKAFNPDIGSIESETLLVMRWRSQWT
ncbi:MAG: DNA methyltransferase [Terriglobales bacterium]